MQQNNEFETLSSHIAILGYRCGDKTNEKKNSQPALKLEAERQKEQWAYLGLFRKGISDDKERPFLACEE